MDGWRYIAQRVLTGEFLDWDVPLTLTQPPRRDLSGPGSLKATVDPEYARLQGPDGLPRLDEWSTAIYVEAAGQIRAGFLLVDSSFKAGQWTLTCAGFSCYPAGTPYLGPDYSKIQIDPADVVRDLWAYVQAQPNSNLGMVVDGTTTPVKIGTTPQNVAFTTGAGQAVSFATADGPYVLNWWEAPDIGQTIDQLAKQTPFDYIEDHRWAVDGSTRVEHRLLLGYPRLGRQRTDLRFVQGENIVTLVLPGRSGTDYASSVLAFGKGSGRDVLHAQTEVVVPGRLRRCKVVTDNTLGTTAAVSALAGRGLKAALPLVQIPAVAVIDHPNAPLGTFGPGDDILVQADVPWLGDIAVWHRVVSDELDPTTGVSILTLDRTEEPG